MFLPAVKEIKLYVPTGDKDDYGQPFYEKPITHKVAVDVKTNIVKTGEGKEKESIMEIEFPAHIQIGKGYRVEYTDPLLGLLEGEILTIEEETDPLGIKVLSRFSNVG